MQTIIIIYETLFGLIIGSFLTVCIYRIPFRALADEQENTDPNNKDTESDFTEPNLETTALENIEAQTGINSPDLDIPLPKNPKNEPLSISSPKRSFCTSCGAELRWYHNIPFFSWIALGGKCAFCKTKISARYPAVELLTTCFALLSFSKFGLSFLGLAIFAFICSLIVISFIDYDYYIIPDVISLRGTALGIVLSGVNHFFHLLPAPFNQSFWDCLWGLAAGAGLLFLVSEVYLRLRKIEGLGMGDVKLLAMAGAFFGPQCALFTIFIGSLLGSVIGLALIIILRKKMTYALPFGPYLAIATALYLLTWQEDFGNSSLNLLDLFSFR